MKSAAAFAVVAAVFAAASPCRALSDAELVQAGHQTYVMHCARCHGVEGKGNGPDAKRVPVTPRDFTAGTFKFRTTASGTPPSDDDLLYVINHGMSGAGMPSFGTLNKDAKAGLIAYLKTFSDVFQKHKPEPVAGPNTKAKYDPTKGKEIYAKVQCQLCHGENGRANGTSAATLAIQPANLSQPWTYRAGADPKDIYFRLMSGLDGTPMPSYKDAISESEAWQVANYVASLQHKAHWSSDIYSTAVTGDLPSEADDARWNAVESTDINLRGRFYEEGHLTHLAVNAVNVKAVHNSSGVALRLFWNDTTQTTEGTADGFLTSLVPGDAALSSQKNLETLYADNAPLDFIAWSAADPNSTRLMRTSLTQALSGKEGAPGQKATASYSDGAWTLVIQWPAPDEKTGEKRVGFAAWNGAEIKQDRYAASRWINLHFDQKKADHQ